MTAAPTALRSRTVTWGDPMVTAAAAGTMPGLDLLYAMERGDLPMAPVGPLVGFEPLEAEHGRMVFGFEPAEFHYNPMGTVHGGIAATLLDSAMGCAVLSTLPAGAGFTTLELKVNYVRPITAATGPMRCEGTVIHAGSRTALAEARLIDAAGTLYSHATSTCLILHGRV